MIEKIIHTFWNGPSNTVAELCINRMRAVHPGWVLIVWNVKDFVDKGGDLCDGFNSLSIQHQGDWIRMCLLCKYGGVWLDSTCVCVKPVTEWIDFESSNVIGFEAPFGDGNLENWAFACPKNHPLMLAWKDEFENAIRSGFASYKLSAPDVVKRNQIFDHMPYLTMHACYIKVSSELGMNATLFRSCEGPFEYLCRVDFATNRAVDSLLIEPYVDPPPLVKLRGAEREYMTERLNAQCERGSFVHEYLNPPLPESNLSLQIFMCVIIAILFQAAAAVHLN